ncbi:MAG: universal stress protein [Methanosarcinaceae archaeon]|nr:universal stress protein [Methanosarcinaceae archaeon]
MESELYKKIIVATDGSENANKAAISGIEIARLSGAKLYALNVIPTIPNLSYFGVPLEQHKEMLPNGADLYEQYEKDGKKILEDIKEMGAKANVQIETVLLEGHPGSEIIDYAEKSNIDLIVVGTLGRTGLDRVIVGSVAQDIVRHAKTRVMIVK